MPDGSWGKIKALPVLKQKYADKYTVGTLVDTEKGYTYYYLELSARYDANLTDSWPGEAFEPIEVDENHTTNGAQNHMGEGQWGRYAYLAGWNGEFKVKYTKDNSNSTIKGMFQKLDEHLLYDSSEGTSDIVSFLAFFENGADISWSYPLQWQYEMYVPVLPGKPALLTITVWIIFFISPLTPRTTMQVLNIRHSRLSTASPQTERPRFKTPIFPTEDIPIRQGFSIREPIMI